MQAEPVSTDSSCRVLKIASCTSMSGKSKLTYHIGCTPDSGVHFRVFENSGTGSYSKEWISLDAVWKALANVAEAKAITSYPLRSLYRGTSANTPAFLLAALLSEGLVRQSTKRRRCQERADDSQFIAEIKSLMASGKVAQEVMKPSSGRTNAAGTGGKPPANTGSNPKSAGKGKAQGKAKRI